MKSGDFQNWNRNAEPQAYYLRQLGARVRLVDAYGPGNSRATSGDETRGVRSSYGDRGIRAELWTTWANRAVDRWTTFDEEWGRQMKARLYFNTGDFIFRAAPETFTERTQALWKQLRILFETPRVEDVARDFPQFDLANIAFALYDPRAGVVRARRACEVVAEALARTFLAERFPQLSKAPLLETRACHYEMSASRNFIVDHFPGFSNVWVAGGGTAEGFKFGPVMGEYIARRVLGIEDDARLAEAFALPA